MNNLKHDWTFGKTPIDLLRLRNSLLSRSSTFEVEIFLGEYSGKSKKVSVSCIPYLRRTLLWGISCCTCCKSSLPFAVPLVYLICTKFPLTRLPKSAYLLPVHSVGFSLSNGLCSVAISPLEALLPLPWLILQHRPKQSI